METKSETLAEGLPREINRVRELQEQYKSLRSTPNVNVEPAILMMEASIQAGIKASAEHDTVAALPAPIPLNTSGDMVCPNCEGTMQYSRWERGAMIQCKTKNCCAVRMNIEAGADWPEPEKVA